MIVGRFLLWARTAPAAQRADAVAALAHAFLHADMSRREHEDAEVALTAMLDDPSPLVRWAMAESLADSPEVPRHLVVALAGDADAIAAVVLSRSPVLTDADLVDCAALGDGAVQRAIALRPYVSVAVSAALAEIAAPAALVALAENGGAEITEASLARMVERCGTDAELCAALLRRADLPLHLRYALSLEASNALPAVVDNYGWPGGPRARRLSGDAREQATVALAAGAGPDDVGRLIADLRRRGRLTPALILRALLSLNLPLAEAAFAELTGYPVARIAGLLHDRCGVGFAALYRRAGLPARLEPAFAAAVAAYHDIGAPEASAGARLSSRMVRRVLSACSGLPREEAETLLALLRRFEVEAAREAARDAAGALADDAALAAVLAYEPMALIGMDERLRDAA
ncbi:MAG TPA: DUF2336 domain-containing protein [Beijerinckiaceae bacterium]|jgi:uncharacterized protein (DUF2336 family)